MAIRARHVLGVAALLDSPAVFAKAIPPTIDKKVR